MGPFWKAAAILVLTVILGVTLDKTAKDISLVLTAVACCLILAVVLGYLSEVMAFLRELGSRCDGQEYALGILLKIAGVAVITELTGLISADAGKSSLGKAMELLGSAAILFLSLPLLEGLFAIIQEIFAKV